MRSTSSSLAAPPARGREARARGLSPGHIPSSPPGRDPLIAYPSQRYRALMSAPPAGWYQDPADPDYLRYWDGARWTEQRTSRQPAPDPAPAPRASTTLGAPSRDRAASRRANRDARALERADQKAKNLAERAARQAHNLETYGPLVDQGALGGKCVELYGNGYVRVALWPTANTPFERLVAIESTADVTKKSAAGRAAGAVVTGGLNLLSSNKRGDLYLTIVTDSRTHVLHVDPPSALDIRRAKRLEGVGRGLLIGHQTGTEAITIAQDREARPGTPSERLRELGELRDQGLVTSAEYEALRARILDDF